MRTIVDASTGMRFEDLEITYAFAIRFMRT